MSDLATLAARFGALLRAGGLGVTPERSARFAGAVLLAEPRTVGELYWLARVTLVESQEQLDLFDRTFAQVFRGMADVADFRGDAPAPPAISPRHPSRELSDSRRAMAQRGSDNSAGRRPLPSRDLGTRDADAPAETLAVTASAQERLRRKDFAACTPEELALLRDLVASLRLVAPRRAARRTADHSSGRRLDVRRTLRRAHRTGGDPARRRYRRRLDKRRRVVLLADVSGSMEAYSRLYLHLLHGAVRGTRAEAFVFATRLTRLTRALRTGRPDVALGRAVAAAPDWSGGTRIGAALKAFNDEHGRRGLARGAVLVIVSDGWERDDPALVRQEMARLDRLAHRIVWVNPRRAAEGYEPLTGGMAAALPYVDTFVAGHSLHALDDVLAAIAG